MPTLCKGSHPTGMWEQWAWSSKWRGQVSESTFRTLSEFETNSEFSSGGEAGILNNDYTIGLPWWLRQWRIHLQCGRPGFNPWLEKIPWRKKWQPTPVFSPGESHGQRSLAGYSPGVTKRWTRLSDSAQHSTVNVNMVIVLILVQSPSHVWLFATQFKIPWGRSSLILLLS